MIVKRYGEGAVKLVLVHGWPEGAALRADGTLLKATGKITCPLYVIHGENDPHPAEGITEPFDEAGIGYTLYKLAKCGHSPWKERHAKDKLKEIILKDILEIPLSRI